MPRASRFPATATSNQPRAIVALPEVHSAARQRLEARRRPAVYFVAMTATLRSVRRFCRHAPYALSACLAALLLIVSSAQALGPHDRRLTNARLGISVEAPAGWILSQHTGYADTVVLLIHPDGSRISVTAAKTEARDAHALLTQNGRGLAAQGLIATPVGPGTRGSLAVDLSAPGRPDKMRQLYLVRDVPLGRQAIVLTLVSETKSFPSRTAALDFVAARLTLDEPLPPSTGSSRGTGSAGAAGNSNPTAR